MELYIVCASLQIRPNDHMTFFPGVKIIESGDLSIIFENLARNASTPLHSGAQWVHRTELWSCFWTTVVATIVIHVGYCFTGTWGCVIRSEMNLVFIFWNMYFVSRISDIFLNMALGFELSVKRKSRRWALRLFCSMRLGNVAYWFNIKVLFY